MTRKSRRTRSPKATREQSDFSIDPNAFDRSTRLEQILIEELQSLISDEATDPALEGIKLLAVHLAPDGGHARVAYAVNREYASRGTVLRDGDELALIPPVSGGAW